MADYKHVVIIFLSTTILIGALAMWTQYKDGKPTPFSDTTPLENLEIPLSPEAQKPNNENTQLTQQQNIPMTSKKATFDTTEGTVVLELFTEQMPITAGNFAKLASEGFYNGIQFHRVIKGFMIQGGDPYTKGTNVASYGTGGPGYAIKDEFVPGLSNVRGTIAMANSGPDSGGSQFFINLVDNTGLDYDKEPISSAHPVFGRVIEGMDIVDKIAGVPTNQRDLPLTPVVIKGITISE